MQRILSTRIVAALVIAAVFWLATAEHRGVQAIPDAATSAPADKLVVLKPDDVVLFQGDSITDGGRQRTGLDYNHIMGQCYAYIIAARLGAIYPERNLNFINKGISGDTVVDLARRWKADTLDVKPNLLSILIGVNDTVFRDPKEEPVEQYEEVYDKLLADTVAALPGVKIVLCEPFLLPVGNTHHWPQMNDPAVFKAEMTGLKEHQDAVARLAHKYHCPEVMLQKAFDDACKKAPASHWSWDGVHPTYAGHGLMAEEWEKTVDRFW